MRNISLKEMSILGLVLVGASAIAATVMPTKDKSPVVRGDAGSLTNSVNNGQTCTTRDIGEDQQCTNTQTAAGPSNTSVSPAITSGDIGGNGDANTTIGS
jgi:hypothetical protein